MGLERNRITVRAASLALSAMVILAMAGACTPTPPPVEDPPSEPTVTPEPEEPAEETIDVLVYLVRGETLGVASRTVQRTETVGSAAIGELLSGPTDQDAEAGLATEIPEGTSLESISIEDGTATVDLSADYESGGGTLSMQLRVAQVIYTLTQFPTVERVSFMIDGMPVEAIGGEGIVVSPPVTREDFADNTLPAILVESPTPWQEVSSPMRAHGMSNTFEATFLYEIVDPSGRIVAEGFVTATSGSGVWGTFDVTLPFEIEQEGIGSLIVFEESAKDGSRVNLVEISLHMKR